MTRLSRADKTSGRDSQQLPQLSKNLLVLIHKLLRRHPRLLRRPLDVHSMLVRPRQVCHVVPAHALVARDHVAHNCRVRRAHVRPRICVINRSSDVKLRLRHSASFSPILKLDSRRERKAAAIGGVSQPDACPSRKRVPTGRAGLQPRRKERLAPGL